jgi:catechol 2,3-dioxygenase-like lactoylglutathione lyase family enzyme
MSSAPVIAAMSHVALRVRDLDAAVQTVTTIMGMREVRRDHDWIYLTCNAADHVVQYRADTVDAVDHLGLAAAGPEALAEVRARVSRGGLHVVSQAPLGIGFDDGIAFVGPDGFVYEVGIGMAADQSPYAPTGVKPTHLGHVNLHVPDVRRCVDFLQTVLDFRISDVIEGRGVFLRCGSEHHAIGVLEGRGVLHHHAWGVPGVGDLSRIGDIVDDLGGTLLWGPLRHGAGNNIAIYFAEPSGAVIEVYTEMEAILNEEVFSHRTWRNDDERWWSRWAKLRGAGFHDYGLPPATLGNGRDGR